MEKKVEVTDKQQQILENNCSFEHLSFTEFIDRAKGQPAAQDLTVEQLVEFLQAANLLYRAGQPIIDDSVYDFIYLAELKKRDPDHLFLLSVEPEPVVEAKTVELPVRMLSTEKAYDLETMIRWAKRIRKAADEIGEDFEKLQFRATPKLDGFAAYDDGEILYTRGDGRRGTDISRVFERGLQVASGGERGLGPGEIVISKSYFDTVLADHFDNSRNFQASLIREKELDPLAAEAVRSGEAVFYPFVLLPSIELSWARLEGEFEEVVDQLQSRVDYDIDGIVFEVTSGALKAHMGATRHHHRWQIAYKQNSETAEVRVIRVVAQTSRSGRVNPVAEIEPTRLSGALIKRATAHHYRMVAEKGIGPDALIRLSRSGEVIPKIEKVLEPVAAEIPQSCPSCGGELSWGGDYLKCINILDCPAQITNSIEHFFKVLGNIDGFGPSSIQKIYENGVSSISSIYGKEEPFFTSCGFGPKQAENMVAQLQRSRVEPVEDWRFLAAFGVHRMGMGNCEKLLSRYPLEAIFELKKKDIEEIKGFSEKIGEEIVSGLQLIRKEFDALYQLGFRLLITALEDENSGDGGQVLSGEVVVFTGTMRQGKREEMKKQAKALGAQVTGSITGKTTLLVCGEKVGAAKLGKAKTLGVEILSEVEYLQRIATE